MSWWFREMIVGVWVMIPTDKTAGDKREAERNQSREGRHDRRWGREERGEK